MSRATTAKSQTPLSPGLLATHLDVVMRSDGRMLLSGYSPGVPPGLSYGDLVVGVSDTEMKTVDWEIVDGAPDSPIFGDPTGWRGGVRAAGDDVGRWTSIATSPAGDTFVSYYDKTQTALKFAHRTGGMWSIHTVDDIGDAGRYTSLVLDATSQPVIAYSSIRPPMTIPGRPIAYARVATGSGDFSNGNWAFTNVHSITIDCRPEHCPVGSECSASGPCMNSPSDSLGRSFVEDVPLATGLYNQLARTPTGLALVFYSRASGDLFGAAFNGNAWGTPFLIDGFGRAGPNPGDSGLSASLFVDGSTWHVTYVNGTDESLEYARIDGGNIVRERIDDGTRDEFGLHRDGRHLVGDDSSVVAMGNGEIRVIYQDSTVQHTIVAFRSPNGGWSHRTLDAFDRNGYWLKQISMGSDTFAVGWWHSPTYDEKRHRVRADSLSELGYLDLARRRF